MGGYSGYHRLSAPPFFSDDLGTTGLAQGTVSNSGCWLKEEERRWMGKD